MEHNSTNSHITPQELDGAARKNYALNGKIMLCSVIILVAAVFAIFCFHSYARCLLRRRLPRRLRRRNHTLRLFESGDVEAGSSAAAAPARGLDLSVLKSLPTFAYSSAVHDPLLECAVCLSEFENDETGRVLPKCNHTFHVDCIDMWFQSHANCPLCRAPVQPGNPVPSALQISVQTIVLVHEPVNTEPEPGFGEAGSSSSSAAPPLGVSVEEPPAREAVETVKSPGGQILTLKRIWSVQ